VSAVVSDITSLAPSRRSGPFPSAEGALEGIDLLEAKQKRDLPYAEARAREQTSCRPMTDVIEEA